jgi:hypothetical protein
MTNLSLDKIGGNYLAPVTIEEGQSGGEGGSRDAPQNRLGNHSPPTRLGFMNGCSEVLAR